MSALGMLGKSEARESTRPSAASRSGSWQGSGHGEPQRAAGHSRHAATPIEPLEIGEVPEGFIVGTITRQDEGRNVCWIAAPQSEFEQDIYCHGSVAWPQMTAPGDVVAFGVHVNRQGRPQASAPLWKRAGRASRGAVSFGTHRGKVRKFLASGSGFVDCDEVKEAHGGDAFIFSSVASESGLSEGQHIAFDVHVNDRGQAQVSMPVWVCCSDEKWLQNRRSGEADERLPWTASDDAEPGALMDDSPRSPRSESGDEDRIRFSEDAEDPIITDVEDPVFAELLSPEAPSGYVSDKDFERGSSATRARSRSRSPPQKNPGSAHGKDGEGGGGLNGGDGGSVKDGLLRPRVKR